MTFPIPEGEAQRLLADFFEAATDAIVTCDSEGRIQAVNSRTEEMFGYSRAELVGQQLEMLVPEKLRGAHGGHRKEYFAKPYQRRMGMGYELSARRKDGSEFPVEISLSVVRGGSRPLALSFITDITERKRLEEQVIQSQRMEAVGRLAGGVAHDFNNLLTVIAGYNRLMLDHLSPNHMLRGYAEEIAKAGERATALTDQLLAFSRRQAIQTRILDVNPLIGALERMVRRLIGEDIELKTQYGVDVPRVKAGSGQIEQVVINLVVNARDAMPHGGKITVETGSLEVLEEQLDAPGGLGPGRYLVLSVQDTGSGMDQEVKSHLFEPFFTTKEQGKGTGLGLSTVYGIVKQNRGDITVESEPGKGSKFTVYLPMAHEEAELVQTAPAPAALALGKETILLVEDQGEVRKLVRELLIRQGYQVLEADSGKDALAVAKQHGGPIHLLLTDVVMPGMGGREVARQLTARMPKLRVIYMSGYPDNEITESADAEEGLLFLQKPFTPDALKRKIRDALA